MKRRNKEKIESISKRRKLDIPDQSLDLGMFLRKAEERCHRVGKLRTYLELDKARMVRRMECLESDNILEDLPAWWKGLEEELCSSRIEDFGIMMKGSSQDEYENYSQQKSENQTGQPYNLVGLVGWWRRQELEGERDRKAREKEDLAARAADGRKKKEKEERISFVRKFFPTTTASPGGTENQVENSKE